MEGHNKINNYVSSKCSGGKYGIKLPSERGADHRNWNLYRLTRKGLH